MKEKFTYLHMLKQKVKQLKHLPIIILGLICISISAFMIACISKEYSNKLQEGIASEIIRFHVIANSDSKEDQELKLKVRDNITNYLEPLLDGVNSVDEARMVLKDNLPTMERLANETISKNNFSYYATASIENVYFPLRVYGDIALPPGEYESVRIKLGNSSGKNWWCIMFPPLCFVDSTYSLVPDSSKEYLKEVLTDEEYDEILIEDKAILEDQDTIKVRPKFKIFTFLNDIFNLD
ncbi:MAG: stage II sporulation protein R [Clostridiales bacterium]|nr:stage II sporulation protein R [Clostridiales bacterium]